jgi:hypothetical protein
MSEWITELECPCCGDVGARANAEGYFIYGQPLVCGCNGQVVGDAETALDIDVDDCPCWEKRVAAQETP